MFISSNGKAHGPINNLVGPGCFFPNGLTGQPHRTPAAMFLRRLRTSAALRRGASDGGVLAALRAELSHELTSSARPIPLPSIPR